jgi:phage gp46-like protein
VEQKGLYPNPFGARLHIWFRLRVAARVRVDAYNVAGEPLWWIEQWGRAGDNHVDWDGVNMAGAACASGAYVLRVQAQGVDGTQGGFWALAALMR